MRRALSHTAGQDPWAGAHARMDERLSRTSPAPLAVAFSGGGDSLALLLAAVAWTRRRGRALIALTVDHRLQSQGAAWATACAAICERLGVTHRTLVWTGDKPATGLPAAARTARHRLLADAAREAGAAVVLMGHTADDVFEAAAMRSAGSTTPSPRVWAPSPVWPEGRGIFLLRPLLGERRADLRQALTELGETWIDDPANDDPRYARARARAGEPEEVGADEPSGALDPIFADDGLGGLVADREAVRGAPPRLILKAAVCAGGGARLPSINRAERLADLIYGGGGFASTLAGARMIVTPDRIHLVREPGEARRGGLAELALIPGAELVWDGRFAVIAHVEGLAIGAAQGRISRLSNAERAALKAWPPAARAAAPVVLYPDGKVSCPILAESRSVQAHGLAYQRLLAATGSICDEDGVADVAKTARAS
ncbi:MAG: tRNA lysidine(34) synthetase TilS [Caulobacteraceae bacterium]